MLSLERELFTTSSTTDFQRAFVAEYLDNVPAVWTFHPFQRFFIFLLLSATKGIFFPTILALDLQRAFIRCDRNPLATGRTGFHMFYCWFFFCFRDGLFQVPDPGLPFLFLLFDLCSFLLPQPFFGFFNETLPLILPDFFHFFPLDSLYLFFPYPFQFFSESVLLFCKVRDILDGDHEFLLQFVELLMYLICLWGCKDILFNGFNLFLEPFCVEICEFLATPVEDVDIMDIIEEHLLQFFEVTRKKGFEFRDQIPLFLPGINLCLDSESLLLLGNGICLW